MRRKVFVVFEALRPHQEAAHGHPEHAARVRQVPREISKTLGTEKALLNDTFRFYSDTRQSTGRAYKATFQK